MTRDPDHLLPSATPVQLIDEHGQRCESGSAVGADLPSHEALLDAYAALVVGRRFNEQAYALVRQGRLAVYPSSHGQEACQVAAAQVLDETDWLFPTYRDAVAMVTRGVDPVATLTLFRGEWHTGYDAPALRVAPQTTPLATQLLHAVGVAHAARLRSEPTVVMALCGDGATSEGDFAEALNFAAVFRTPVVFLVQNNQYAISVPLSRQSAAPSLAHKGVGHGVPSERVDGNDVAALLAVLTDAVGRARNGEGPQLVEAHTYRVAAHTNADDPGRYRDSSEVDEWIARDPLTRVATYLRSAGALDDARQVEFDTAAERVATALRIDTAPQKDPGRLFAQVFASPTPQLQEQAALVRDEMSREVDV
ncbi:thiamine pyrophosphate-dependent enzyme [Cryptosporangium sp. NPDC048952]|uniref:thiamine pyrophosphate-dependent enzyme n=1 Tax=Cryptosporangium sp. NPDC048952 TaxID=3363961 RepID=UPI00371DE7C6